MSLFNKAIDYLLQNNSYNQALPLIERALSLTKDDFIKNSLKLKKLKALILEENYFKASLVLKEIKLNLNSPSTKRFLQITDLFLSANLANEEPELSKRALIYLATQKQFFYLALELARTSQATLSDVGRYLLARFLINEKDYDQALIITEEILNNKLLPKELENEALLMQIETLIALKDDKALIAFKLLPNDYQPAVLIGIQEKLNHLIFNHIHN